MLKKMKSLKKLKYGHKPTFILLALTSFISIALGAVVTYFMGRLIDYGMNQAIDEMLSLAQGIIIIIMIDLVFAALISVTRSIWMEKSLTILKSTYIDNALKLDILDVQKDQTASMFSHLTNDFDRFESKYLENLTTLIYMISQLIVGMALMVIIHPVIIVVPVMMTLFLFKNVKKTSEPVKQKEKIKSTSLDAYTQMMNETIQGYEVIKAHQLEETREALFLQKAIQVQKDNYEVDVQTSKSEAINSFIISVMVTVMIIGGMLVSIEIGLSFGSVMIIFSAVGQTIWPISSLSRQLSEMKGIEEVLDNMDKYFDIEVRDRQELVGDFESIVFSNNQLGYVDQTILENVSLYLNKGEKILIVGPSGAGKSTILKTIRQGIVAKEGMVTLNGKNILEIKEDNYFSKFSTIDQVGFIFSGTLRDNITLYQSIDPNRVETIMQQVGLGQLSLGTMIQNDGSNLSGGQRARVLLARALCLQAQVIIADEIFASLDADIAQRLEKDLLSFDQTLINVSHIFFEENLSDYDRIYIVENHTVRVARGVEEVQERMLEQPVQLVLE